MAATSTGYHKVTIRGLRAISPTGSSSPRLTSTVVGYRVYEGPVTPTHGVTTTWPSTSIGDFNEVSYSGSKDISSESGLGITMDEGKKRYKNFEIGVESGLYPDSNMISGFEWSYFMTSQPANTYHNNWVQRYGVVFENGNFYAFQPLTKQSKGGTGMEHTVTQAIDSAEFQAAHRGTAIRYFRFNISTEGGSYRTRATYQIRKLRFILRSGYSTSHKIILPPNRPYSERNNRHKLTR